MPDLHHIKLLLGIKDKNIFITMWNRRALRISRVLLFLRR